MDIQEYLISNFKSREIANAVLKDFSVFKRRVGKWFRGTNDCHSIMNLVIGIENTFDREFIEHFTETRLTLDERKIYRSCLKSAGIEFSGDYSRQFHTKLESELFQYRRGRNG